MCKNHYPVDIHSVKGGAKLLHEREGNAPYFAPDAYHELPYRCLLPQGIANLLVPGRAASSSFEAQSSIRVQQNCHSMGEAAGVAAAWAAREYGGECGGSAAERSEHGCASGARTSEPVGGVEFAGCSAYERMRAQQTGGKMNHRLGSHVP